MSIKPTPFSRGCREKASRGHELQEVEVKFNFMRGVEGWPAGGVGWFDDTSLASLSCICWGGRAAGRGASSREKVSRGHELQGAERKFNFRQEPSHLASRVAV